MGDARAGGPRVRLTAVSVGGATTSHPPTSLWNDYIWPLVVMIDPEVVFLIGARHFLRDLAAGAMRM